MTEDGRLAWGILGTGNIARKFCRGLTHCRKGFAASVGSRSQPAATQFAAEFGIQQFHSGYEQVLADPQLDAVYLALPNSMHNEWTIRALEAGKHVLCEKPIAANKTEAIAMFETARRVGRVLVEAFMYRAHPQTQEVIDKVRMSAIGQVKLVRTSFCYHTNRIAGNVRFDPALAGGALMDIGCYCVNLSLAIAAVNPIEVTATAVMHENGVDEFAAGHMKFANGIIATFMCGMSVQADNTAYICGSQGYLEIPRPWKPEVDGARYWLKTTPPPSSTILKMEPPPIREFTVGPTMDPFALEADDFASTVLDGKRPFVTEEESIATMGVLDEMRRQIRTCHY